MSPLPRSLKPSAALVIGLTNKYRFDLFFRTTVHIVALEIFSVLVTLAVFWWAIDYAQGELVRLIIEHLNQAILAFPQTPPESLPQAIEGVRLQIGWYVVFGVTVIAALFGYLLARLTLRPARNSLAFQKQFIGNIAHELRTPLSTIKINTEVALLESGLPQEIEKTLKDTITELDRLSEIINNLLSFDRLMRPERMRYSALDLGVLVDEVAKRHAPVAKVRGIELLVRKHGERNVWGNAIALEQVVTNLLKNAIAYTPKNRGGRVTVSIEPRGEETIALTVSDTGIGIAQKDLFRIFEPFYRGDTSRTRGLGTGTSGLGLAIVNEIVRLHHGRTHIQSALGRGTAITIVLPRSPRAELSESSVHTSAPLNEVSVDFSRHG